MQDKQVVEIAGRQYDAHDVIRLADMNRFGRERDLRGVGDLFHHHDLFLRGDKLGRTYEPTEPGLLLFTTPTKARLLSREPGLVDILVEAPQMAVGFGQSEDVAVPRLGVYALDGNIQAVERPLPPNLRFRGPKDDAYLCLESHEEYGFKEVIGVDSLYNSNGTVYQICDVHFNGSTSRVVFKFENAIFAGKSVGRRRPKGQGDIITPSGYEDAILNIHKAEPGAGYKWGEFHPQEVGELGKRLDDDGGRRVDLLLTPRDLNQVFYVGPINKIENKTAYLTFIGLTDKASG